jgi:hypothetical protein
VAATAAGAEALVSSRHAGAPVAAATGGSSSAPTAALAACPTQPPQGDRRQPLPPTAPSTAASTPPGIGAEFSGGGVISAPGTATSVTVKVDGGPLAGSTLTLAVTPSSRVFESSPLPAVHDVAASSTQLNAGQVAKFTATRTGTASYALDEIHAGPVPGSDTPPALKQSGEPAPGSDAQPGLKQSGGPALATPPAVGDPFKVGGIGVSSTNDSITVNVTQGNLSGIITFTLTCRPPQNVAGQAVDVAGTRTATNTYTAQVLIVNPPDQGSGAASHP